ncbi:MAPK regulated corepressor interacting protein 2 isoform X2 [Hyperolius riggenbachi]|uniref:MAPK regulated corepressor interacting protein 2 isoform X2 n=1 Tax=Hyperolius riggenbachi TaxID=752182 RepID=UPI0035A3B0EA
MYTITRGPSKLTTQRRTGPTQQIDTKLQELKIKQQLLINTSANAWDSLPSCAPKLVFNRVNGKRAPALRNSPEEEVVYTPAHEENVRFVYQAWQEVQHQLEKPELNGCGPKQYQDQASESSLKTDFVPIDLEEWWAERFLANIENCA